MTYVGPRTLVSSDGLDAGPQHRPGPGRVEPVDDGAPQAGIGRADGLSGRRPASASQTFIRVSTYVTGCLSLVAPMANGD
jgi:hypothetical protein